MEHSKTNKPVLTALDILQFRNLQKNNYCHHATSWHHTSCLT